MTVLFCDVQGLDALGQFLDPEEITEVLNGYFDSLAQCVSQLGGTIDKYLSDGLMVLFGAPTAHEDDPERALLCALAMLEQSKAIRSGLADRTGVTLQLRIGIHTGLVVAGEVGGEAKRDYTVMGDTVNVAQRLKATARPDQILVSAETFQLTHVHFGFKALEPIQVKGRTELVSPYELLASREDEGSGGREQIRILGRRDEMWQLEQALERATEGRPQLVSVVGETGVGKSRLVREFLHGFEKSAAGRLLEGRGLSYQQDSDYALLGNVLAQFLAIPVGAAPEEVAQACARVAMEHWPQEVQRRAALLAHLLRIDATDPAVGQLLPAQRRAAAYGVLNELLFALARQGTLVLSLEDLHWADEASLQWLAGWIDFLAAHANVALPVMILVQYRPRDDVPVEQFARKIEVSKIVLLPLAAPDAMQLFGALLDLPLEPAAWKLEFRNIADAALARAEGNPLFLSALVQSLTEQGILQRGHTGEWEVARSTSELRLPDSIRRVVISRLDALADPLRSLITAAAVIGRAFDPGLVAVVEGGESVAERLAALVRLNLIHRRNNGEYAFDQMTTQEVAYQSLLQGPRRELHRRAGEALERMLGDRWEQAAGLLARHFYHGGDAARAVRYLMVAGEQARQRFANREAMTCLRHALQLATESGIQADIDRGGLLASLARVEAAAGEYGHSLEHLEEALELAPDDARRAEVEQQFGDVLEEKGEFKAALKRYRNAMSLLERSHAPLALARLKVSTARLLSHQGDAEACLLLARDVIVEFSGQGDDPLLAEAHEIVGSALLSQGRLDEALAEHNLALEAHERHQDPFGCASAKHGIGLVLIRQGDWPAAAGHLEDAMAGYSRCGDLVRVAQTQADLGDLNAAFGESQLAERLGFKALETFERMGSRFGEARARVGI
ncbi:MAG: AAA family ATPase, partial [Cyanobacteria bacterium REEB65]|nr:AAA family ATPase [Cyanobacteria bacterium REEB65]